MITCKEASYLASKKLDSVLTWRESFGLGLHVLICKLCRKYGIEIKKLHGLMKQASESNVSVLSESIKLSEQSRERIKDAFEKALHQTE